VNDTRRSRRPARPNRGARQRASALLIVLAVLSAMTLLVIALAYTSRLELQTARNFAEHTQRRAAELTGVEVVANRLGKQLPDGATGILDLSLDPEFLRRRPGPLGEREALAAVAAADTVLAPRRLYGRPAGETSTAFRNLGTPFAPRPLVPAVPTTGMVVEVRDLNGLVNINAASEEVLEALFRRVIEENRLRGSASRIARAIVEWRLGEDGQPGVAGKDDDEGGTLTEDARTADARRRLGEAPERVRSLRQPVGQAGRGAERENRLRDAAAFYDPVDDPSEFIADIRYPAYGDDRRFGSVRELAFLGKDVISPEVIAAAAPYLTVFSVAHEHRIGSDLLPTDLLDLNRATAEEIYGALRAMYEADGTPKDDQLLRQFAANLADARDADRVPTQLPAAEGSGTVLGFERTPVLTTVYALPQYVENPSLEGQFVQVYNPWPETFSLDGWRIETGTQRAILRGTLPPGGMLVLTNDRDNSSDPQGPKATPGEGSLYDIFGTVAAGPQRQVVEQRSFTLPTAKGVHTIRLVSGDGDLVDEFQYEIKDPSKRTLSGYTRPHPFVRETLTATVRPFTTPTADASEAQVRSLTMQRLQQQPADAPFTSLLQVLEVPAIYATPDAKEGHRDGFPVIASPRSTQPGLAETARDPRRIDARVIDLFAIDRKERRSRRELLAALTDQDGDGRLNDARQRRLEDYRSGSIRAEDTSSPQAAWHRYAERPAGSRYGLVNLNSAPQAVLAALPGLDGSRAQYLLRRREQLESLARAGYAADGLLYRRFSDVLCDDELWGDVAGGEAGRRKAFEALYNASTLNSRSFLLVGRRAPDATSGTGTSGSAAVEAMVATDRPGAELVALRMVP
jgi:DNA uptake protein ComE-like DNA-binding protein